ncbi:MAG: LysE family translocator [Kangiellaceae bacterium]|nr:LysE family translocator [Kangiellaceae bacterium]
MTLIFTMILFSLTMSATPGPVNLITLASGVNHGFRKTLPFVSGATIGFVLLLAAIGLGLSLVAEDYPQLLMSLRYIGSGFIAFMAFSIIRARGKLKVEKGNRPTFVQGVFLQWLNPKAWMACIAGVTAFNSENTVSILLLFITIYFLVCYVCIALWALAGDKISRWLVEKIHYERFNLIMGSVLMLVAVYLAFLQ